MCENKSMTKGTIIFYRIVIIIVFLFVIVLFGHRSITVIKTINVKRNGTIVKAEIIDIVYSNIEGANEYGSGSGVWDLKYLYVDENGVSYSDVIPYKVRDEAVAEAQIGKTVDIYIDGRGYSLAVDYAYENYTWSLLREGGIFILCVVGFAIYVLVITLKYVRRKRKVTM